MTANFVKLGPNLNAATMLQTEVCAPCDITVRSRDFAIWRSVCPNVNMENVIRVKCADTFWLLEEQMRTDGGTILRALKSPNYVAVTFLTTVLLLPRGAKLVSCLGCNLTSVHSCEEPTFIKTIKTVKMKQNCLTGNVCLAWWSMLLSCWCWHDCIGAMTDCSKLFMVRTFSVQDWSVVNELQPFSAIWEWATLKSLLLQNSKASAQLTKEKNNHTLTNQKQRKLDKF